MSNQKAVLRVFVLMLFYEPLFVRLLELKEGENQMERGESFVRKRAYLRQV